MKNKKNHELKLEAGNDRRKTRSCCECEEESENIPPLSEEELPDFDLDMDVDEAVVRVIDGVVIEGDTEEIRMLFYHHKPDPLDVTNNMIRCKAVAELRSSCKTFNKIAKDFGRLNNGLKKRKKTVEQCSNRDRVPMFV